MEGRTSGLTAQLQFGRAPLDTLGRGRLPPLKRSRADENAQRLVDGGLVNPALFLDSFTAVKVIAQSPQATVLEATYRGKAVVLKEAPLATCGENFATEVGIMARLDHPCIVKFLDCFLDRGHVYIVMEHGGRDLSSFFKEQKRPLSEDTILDICVQIALALKHAHDRKVLHRDVKPSNVFLTDNDVVKVGDFGMSVALKNTFDQVLSRTGTPYYISPEIWLSTPYDHKSDIWAFGIVMYEAATRKPPFDGKNMRDLASKIVAGHFEPIPTSYSKEFRDLVSATLSVDPEARPRINDVLELDLFKSRIPKWLAPDVLDEEFSHTVLHGYDLLDEDESSLNGCLPRHSSFFFPSEPRGQEGRRRESTERPFLATSGGSVSSGLGSELDLGLQLGALRSSSPTRRGSYMNASDVFGHTEPPPLAQQSGGKKASQVCVLL